MDNHGERLHYATMDAKISEEEEEVLRYLEYSLLRLEDRTCVREVEPLFIGNKVD